MTTRKLTELSLLTALALIIFVIELRIPNLCPIPGVKLGLANIITIYSLYHFRASETAMLVFARILLGAMFSGNLSSLLYSISGAVLCLTGTVFVKRIIPEKHLWLCSIVGAILHNTGQILAAVLVMKTTAVWAYYPVLLVSGCIAGAFTGLAAQMILRRFAKGDVNMEERTVHDRFA